MPSNCKQRDGGIKVALRVWGPSWEGERIIREDDVICKI